MRHRCSFWPAILCIAGFIIIEAGCGSSGGGSITPTPPPTITSVTVSPSTATVATGKTATFTASVSGTGNYSTAVTWSASGGATISSSGVLTAPASAGSVTVTATSTADAAEKGTATVTVVLPVSVSISAASSTVNMGGSDDLSATVANGDGKATVTWNLASGSAGSLSATTGATTAYQAPATITAPTTVSITATATDSTGSATSQPVTITVDRVITFGVSLPNNQVHLDYSGFANIPMTCTGCESTDTLNVQFMDIPNQPTASQSMSSSSSLASWVETISLTGYLYVPDLFKIWISGADGIMSNVVWITFNGSQNEAVADPSTREVYYYSAGNGTSASGSITKFTSSGTADGSFSYGQGAAAIAFDGQSIYVTSPSSSSLENGINTYNSTGGLVEHIQLTNGQPLAISAAAGLACVTIPTGYGSPNSTDAVDCNNSSGTFVIPGIPQGSQPVAIDVVSSSEIAFYGRGDQTLRMYSISGTTAAAAGTVQIPGLTPTDSTYWKNYPNTGGWDLVQAGTLNGYPQFVVMGQVVDNSNNSVSQKAAIVFSQGGTGNTAPAYVVGSTLLDLPAGTVHIAYDASNNAIMAEYVDSSVSPPVMRFEDLFLSGNTNPFGSTSSRVPGAGFLATQQDIVTCAGGGCDFQPK